MCVWDVDDKHHASVCVCRIRVWMMISCWQRACYLNARTWLFPYQEGLLVRVNAPPPPLALAFIPDGAPSCLETPRLNIDSWFIVMDVSSHRNELFSSPLSPLPHNNPRLVLETRSSTPTGAWGWRRLGGISPRTSSSSPRYVHACFAFLSFSAAYSSSIGTATGLVRRTNNLNVYSQVVFLFMDSLGCTCCRWGGGTKFRPVCRAKVAEVQGLVDCCLPPVELWRPGRYDENAYFCLATFAPTSVPRQAFGWRWIIKNRWIHWFFGQGIILRISYRTAVVAVDMLYSPPRRLLVLKNRRRG